MKILIRLAWTNLALIVVAGIISICEIIIDYTTGFEELGIVFIAMESVFFSSIYFRREKIIEYLNKFLIESD